MGKVRLEWWRYKVPFRVAIETAHGVLRWRRGLLLRYTAVDGVSGWGEAAPLESFGQELRVTQRALPQAVRVAEALWCLGSERGFREAWRDPSWLGHLRELPVPLTFGVELAVASALVKREGKSLVDCLEGWHQVPVNATVGVSDVEQAVSLALRAVEAGFRTIKLKVGICGSVQQEIALIQTVRAALQPEIRLRLDANGKWSITEAITVLRSCTDCDIELVEQPVEDVTEFRAIAAVTEASLAVDEALADAGCAAALMEAEGIAAFVLKPTVLGGIAATLNTMRMATMSGKDVLVTSSFETGVGVVGCLIVASCLPAFPYACGMATFGQLESDFLKTTPSCYGSWMEVPRGIGLGVEVAEPLLAAWTQENGVLEGDG